MKRITLSICLIALSGALSFFTSCSKGPVTFTVPITVTGIPLSATGILNSANTSASITKNIDSIILANGGDTANITSITLTSMSETITSPAGATFAGLWFSSANVIGGGDTIKTAYLSGSCGTGSSFNDSLQYSNVAPVLKLSSFKLTLGLYDSTAGPFSDTISASMVFTVTAKGK